MFNPKPTLLLSTLLINVCSLHLKKPSVLLSRPIKYWRFCCYFSHLMAIHRWLLTSWCGHPTWIIGFWFILIGSSSLKRQVSHWDHLFRGVYGWGHEERYVIDSSTLPTHLFLFRDTNIPIFKSLTIWNIQSSLLIFEISLEKKFNSNDMFDLC